MYLPLCNHVTRCSQSLQDSFKLAVYDDTVTSGSRRIQPVPHMTSGTSDAKLNTSLKQNGLAFLNNFFTLAANQADIISPFIRGHIANLPIAAENDAIKLWSYNLAFLLKMEFMDEQGEFSNVVKEYFGSKFYTKILNFFEKKNDFNVMVFHPKHDIAKKLCMEFLEIIFIEIRNQYVSSDKIIALLPTIANNINGIKGWSNQDFDTLRKQTLAEQLKLDAQNVNHCQFWNTQVQDSGLIKGGVEYTLNEMKYYLPHRIAKIHEATQNISQYQPYLDQVNLCRQDSTPIVEAFRQDKRSTITRQLYAIEDPQLLNVNKLR